jgi:hypothetical protein
MMKWKELLSGLTAHCQFHEPVAVFQLDRAERQLSVALPSDLREVLRETNGVEGEYELALLWPLDRIIEDNQRFRSSKDFKSVYMPFDHLLFIADAGNGDQFAFPVDADGTIRRPDVFVWNHEDDSRRMVAPSLKCYFECGSLAN